MRLVLQLLDLTEPPSLRGTGAPTPTLRGSFLVSLLKIDGDDLSRCPGYFLIHLSSFLSYFLSRMCVFSVVGIETLLYHSPLYLLRQELMLSPVLSNSR